MECKAAICRKYSGLSIVLIETLWNVKTIPFGLYSPTNAVLIETLWNVKILAIIRETISEMY